MLQFDVHSKASLQELSSVLEQELLNYDHENAVYQVAMHSCRHELKYLKGILETSIAEKEKLTQVSFDSLLPAHKQEVLTIQGL